VYWTGIGPPDLFEAFVARRRYAEALPLLHDADTLALSQGVEDDLVAWEKLHS
jgi:hypothetical protein